MMAREGSMTLREFAAMWAFVAVLVLGVILWHNAVGVAH